MLFILLKFSKIIVSVLYAMFMKPVLASFASTLLAFLLEVLVFDKTLKLKLALEYSQIDRKYFLEFFVIQYFCTLNI